MGNKKQVEEAAAPIEAPSTDKVETPTPQSVKETQDGQETARQEPSDSNVLTAGDLIDVNETKTFELKNGKTVTFKKLGYEDYITLTQEVIAEGLLYLGKDPKDGEAAQTYLASIANTVHETEFTLNVARQLLIWSATNPQFTNSEVVAGISKIDVNRLGPADLLDLYFAILDFSGINQEAAREAADADYRYRFNPVIFRLSRRDRRNRRAAQLP